ncbi:MAG: Peptidase T [Candidatus Erwinia impunctatus]|nr:Peptidase T [Culicoides impunctatus]
MNKLLDRFLDYVSLDTQSKPHVRQVPSTSGQRDLARQLCEELTLLGLTDITLSDQGVVMATLPAKARWPVPVVGFIAHLDTSPDFSSKHVKPQIIENYRGGDIALGIGNEILSPVMFPVLHQLIGHTLITTDGTTLLGADDKAGIAGIITAMARLRASETPHGEVRIAFTPDEEVGKGMTGFDTTAFAVEWAYTVDGGHLGEFEIENFNAASAVVRVTGNQAHPGFAKGVMVNALSLAMQFHRRLPADEVPEMTADREGFYHLQQMKGTAEKAELHYLIRDFSIDEFAKKTSFCWIPRQCSQLPCRKAVIWMCISPTVI